MYTYLRPIKIHIVLEISFSYNTTYFYKILYGVFRENTVICRNYKLSLIQFLSISRYQ